ncbi:uncharacterized protein LOC106145193 [Ictidomys tridecemlineatus]
MHFPAWTGSRPCRRTALGSRLCRSRLPAAPRGSPQSLAPRPEPEPVGKQTLECARGSNRYRSKRAPAPSTPPLEPLPRLSARGARATGTAAAGAGAAAHAVVLRAQESVEPTPRRSDAAGAQQPWPPTPPQECGIPWGQGEKPPPPPEPRNPETTLRPTLEPLLPERGSESSCRRRPQSPGASAAPGAREPPLLLLESPFPGHWATRRRHPQHTGAKATLAAFRVQEPAAAPPPPGTGAQPLPEHKSTGTTVTRRQHPSPKEAAPGLAEVAPAAKAGARKDRRSPADSCLLLQGQRPCRILESLKKEENG